MKTEAQIRAFRDGLRDWAERAGGDALRGFQGDNFLSWVLGEHGLSRSREDMDQWAADVAKLAVIQRESA